MRFAVHAGRIMKRMYFIFVHTWGVVVINNETDAIIFFILNIYIHTLYASICTPKLFLHRSRRILHWIEQCWSLLLWARLWHVPIFFFIVSNLIPFIADLNSWGTHKSHTLTYIYIYIDRTVVFFLQLLSTELRKYNGQGDWSVPLKTYRVECRESTRVF